MRKYYQPRAVRERDPTTRLAKPLDVWALLESFVRDSAERCSHKIPFNDLFTACRERSVAKYLSASRDLEAYAQLNVSLLETSEFFLIRQAVCLLKKFPFADSDLPTDPRTTAIEKWKSAEDQCRKQNAKLISEKGLEPSWVPYAKQFVAEVLGDLSPERIMKMVTLGRHGPGSTLSSDGNRVSAYYKFADLPYTVTTEALPYAYAAISADPKWLDYLESSGRRRRLPPPNAPRFLQEIQILQECVNIEDSDKVTFVPKDCATHRPIAVGASLNIFLQLGVKSYMEERLKLFGVDLTDQSRNQEYARLGAAYSTFLDCEVNPRQFSTIDLASASDTVSIELVRLLLPPDWFAFLDDLRHKKGVLDDVEVNYEKFSAMGNGFTFPLESLIFFAICKASHRDNGWQFTKNDFAVYGDDIIVRRYAADSCIANLEWAGFTINKTKSFVEGPFKESCGCDYHFGYNVRPFYLKRSLNTYGDIYHMMNWIAFKIRRCPWASCLSIVYSTLLASIPLNARAYGPYVEGSEAYISVTFSEMSALGIRPFLSATERYALLQSKIMKDDCFCLQSPFYIDTLVVAKPYRARYDVQYLLWLRNSFSPHIVEKRYDPMAKVLAKTAGNLTYRRNSVSRVTRACPIQNWNGSLTSLEQRRDFVFYEVCN